MYVYISTGHCVLISKQIILIPWNILLSVKNKKIVVKTRLFIITFDQKLCKYILLVFENYLMVLRF